jgi:hypothetical protein
MSSFEGRFKFLGINDISAVNYALNGAISFLNEARRQIRMLFSISWSLNAT